MPVDTNLCLLVDLLHHQQAVVVMFLTADTSIGAVGLAPPKEVTISYP
jgi:hypothetical protein